MEIKARYIMGTPEELANVEAIVEDATATTLLYHDLHNGNDWARASRRDSLTLGELYQELRAVLEHYQAQLGGMDYFSQQWTYDTHLTDRMMGDRPIPRLTGTTKLGDLRYRWIAVFPVTGGSEGHYVHVDLLWQADYTEGRIPLFLGKTFGGHAEAVTLAGILARVLGV